MDKSELLSAALQTSRAALQAGDRRTAVFQATVAANLAEELQHREAAADANGLLMQHLFTLGRFESALGHGRRALAGWRALQQPERECEVLAVLAACCAEHDVPAEGLGFARAAFDLARRHALPQRLVQSLSLLGVLHGRLADWAQGEALLLQALSRARDLHDAGAIVRALNSLIALLLEAHAAQSALGDAPLAGATAQRLLQHGRRALALCSEQPDGFRRVVMRSNAAATLMVNGWLDDALALLRSCVQLARAEGFRVVELKARHRVALCLLAQGELAAAEAEAVAMLHDLDGDDHVPARIDCTELLATLAGRAGDEAAVAALHAAVAPLQAIRQEARLALGDALRRNAIDVVEALAEVDSEWFDSRSQPDAG